MRYCVMLLFLVTCPFASAQGDEDAPKGTRLPFNPFENAKQGDWVALQGTACENGKEHPRLLTWEVTSVADGKVTVRTRTTGPDMTEAAKAPTDLAFPQEERPTVEQLIDVRDGSVLSHVEAGEDDYERFNRKLRCQVVRGSLQIRDERFRVAVHLCRDLRGCGIASIGMLPERGGADGAMTLDLVGYGSKDRVELGTRPPH